MNTRQGAAVASQRLFWEAFPESCSAAGSGYNKVEDVILAVCSAHCRRKFYEALPAQRQKQQKLLDIMEKAVNYALNHKETLCNYMLDGRCELSNNAAERRDKSYAIGRKDSLFHTSAAGAEANALVYSMIETAKANKINVFQYLYVLLLYMRSIRMISVQLNSFFRGVILSKNIVQG